LVHAVCAPTGAAISNTVTDTEVTSATRGGSNLDGLPEPVVFFLRRATIVILPRMLETSKKSNTCGWCVVCRGYYLRDADHMRLDAWTDNHRPCLLYADSAGRVRLNSNLQADLPEESA
jgi:hypothetical protein